MPRCLCAVQECRVQGGHRFPQDPELRSKWIAALNKPRTWQPSRKSVVCFKHFLEEDYTELSISGDPLPMMRLRPGAVPSRFEFTEEDEQRIARLSARREALKRERDQNQQLQQKIVSPSQLYKKRQSETDASSKLRTRVPVPRRFDEVDWPGSTIRNRANSSPKDIPKIEVDRDMPATAAPSTSKSASAGTSSAQRKMGTQQPASLVGTSLQQPVVALQGPDGALYFMSSSSSSSVLQNLRTSGAISLLSGAGTTLRLTPATSTAPSVKGGNPALPKTFTLVKQTPGGVASSGGKSLVQIVANTSVAPSVGGSKAKDKTVTLMKGLPPGTVVLNGNATVATSTATTTHVPVGFKWPLPVSASSRSSASQASSLHSTSTPTLKVSTVMAGNTASAPSILSAKTVLTTQPMKSLLNKTTTSGTGTTQLRSLIPKSLPGGSQVIVSTQDSHSSAATDALEAVRILESLTNPGSETMLVPVKSKSIGTSVSEEDPHLEQEEVDFGPSVPTTMQNPWTTATYHKLLTPMSTGTSVVSSAGKEMIVVRPEKAIASPRREVLVYPVGDSELPQQGKTTIRLPGPITVSAASTARAMSGSTPVMLAPKPMNSTTPTPLIISASTGSATTVVTSKPQVPTSYQFVRISPSTSSPITTITSSASSSATSGVTLSTSTATSTPIINPEQSARSKTLQALQLSKNAARQATLKARAEKKKRLEMLPVVQNNLSFPVMQMMPEGNVYLVNPNMDLNMSSGHHSSDDDKDSDYSGHSSERDSRKKSPPKVVFPFNKSLTKKGKKTKSSRAETPPAATSKTPEPEEPKDSQSDMVDFDLSRVKTEPVEEEEETTIERLVREEEKMEKKKRHEEELKKQEEEQRNLEEELMKQVDELERQEERRRKKEKKKQTKAIETPKQQEEIQVQPNESQKPQEEEEDAFPFLKITSVFSLSNQDADARDLNVITPPAAQEAASKPEPKPAVEEDPDPLEDRIITFHPCNVVLERLEQKEEGKPEKFAKHRARCSQHCRERHVKYLCNLKLIPCETFTHDPKPGKPSRFKGRKFLSAKAKMLQVYNECMQKMQEQKKATPKAAEPAETKLGSIRSILQTPPVPVTVATKAAPSTAAVTQTATLQTIIPGLTSQFGNKFKVGAPITLKLPSTALAGGVPVGEPGKRPTFLLYKIGNKQILAPLNDPTFAKILQSSIKTPGQPSGSKTGSTSQQTPGLPTVLNSFSLSNFSSKASTTATATTGIPIMVTSTATSNPRLLSAASTAKPIMVTPASLTGGAKAVSAGRNVTVWKPLDSNVRATPMPTAAATALASQNLMDQHAPSKSLPLSYVLVPSKSSTAVSVLAPSVSPAAASTVSSASSGASSTNGSQKYSLPPGVRIKPEPKTKGYGDEEPEPEPEPSCAPKESSASGKKAGQKRDAPPELVPQVRIKQEKLDAGYGDVDVTPAAAAEPEPPQLEAENGSSSSSTFLSLPSTSSTPAASSAFESSSAHSHSTPASSVRSSSIASSSVYSSSTPTTSRLPSTSAQQNQASSTMSSAEESSSSAASCSTTRFSSWGRKRSSAEPGESPSTSTATPDDSYSPPPTKLQKTSAHRSFHNERISKLKERMRQQELYLEELQRQREQQAHQNAFLNSDD